MADKGFRILQSGMLSKTADYCLIVTGEIGEPEMETLIKKLSLDLEFAHERARNDDTD